VSRSNIGSIDRIVDAVHGTEYRPDVPLAIHEDSLVMCSGWAADVATKRPAAAAYVIIDGRVKRRALYGFPRPDVAAYLGSEMYRTAGFRFYFDPEMLEPGAHEIEILTLDADGRERPACKAQFVLERSVPPEETAAETKATDLLPSGYWERFYESQLIADQKPRDWLAIPHVNLHYVNPLTSGSPGDDWFIYCAKNYFSGMRLERVLDLGCGTGTLERRAFELGVPFGCVIGFDMSATAIAEANRDAQTRGYASNVEFRCADFTIAEFPDRHFDVITINMALHHVLELEQLIEKLSRWLAPNGLLLVNEYVGPNRFQWKRKAIELGNTILARIPERLRVHGVTGDVVTEMWRPSLRGMIEGDPSEAIRSADIVPLLTTYFEVVERRDYGGTLLQPLLVDIAHNFQPDEREEDMEILRFLFAEEQRLIVEGVLESNFAFMVLK
jgi:SAM-dependent methyltransferase